MSLHQINLRAEFKHRYSKAFSEESWSIAELYYSSLKSYNTEKVKKCTIQVSDKWQEKEFHYTSFPDHRAINLTIDFVSYFNADRLEKKKIQLDIIHKGMLLIAEKEDWSIPPLVHAYNHCLSEGLEFKFFVGNKLKSSPDRKRKIGLWCEWDIDLAKLFWVLFDKNGVELNRDIIVSFEPSQGETVYYLKWAWMDNKTVCIQDKYRVSNKWLIDLIDPNENTIR
ncbi:hypothetical protein PQ465_19205 [Sphingobacterium oryzagri]|uniref:Uncharacterized protein n=1 Tax=Sphingobacterium oryzagri TaxID=3025669 RepID=A0ABY7WIJ2_9SPHI|nr:hypothetical protein [Sphingobacterium sp. KACC 22765]WDF68409.1 hypothetical protein PQ465_19205 [Sphingobacterium sp. KACC 22765]